MVKGLPKCNISRVDENGEACCSAVLSSCETVMLIVNLLERIESIRLVRKKHTYLENYKHFPSLGRFKTIALGDFAFKCLKNCHESQADAHLKELETNGGIRSWKNKK